MRSPKTMVMVPAIAISVFLSATVEVGLAQSCPLFGDPEVLNANAALDSGSDEFPQLAIGSGGLWLAVWSSSDPLGGIGTDRDILYARSTDDGVTWTDPAPLNTNADSDGDGADTVPQVTTDSAGQWVVVWRSNTNLGGIGTDEDILFALSADNGATWTDPMPLNTNAGSDDGDDEDPQVTTDSSGNWLAVWSSDDPLGGIGTDKDILFAHSTNNGANWTAPAALNTNAATDTGNDSFPEVDTDSGGNWVAVWASTENLDMMIGSDQDILVARSTSNDGSSWTAPAALNTIADSDTGTDNEPAVTTDGAGRWVAVWQSQETLGGTIGTDNDIFVAFSADNGASWSDTAVLNSNAASDGAAQDNLPQVTPDGLGRWLTVWGSTADLGGAIGGDFDCLSSLSTDNGSAWRPPVPLNTNAASDTPADTDTRPHVTRALNGQWVAVWQSNTDLGGSGTDNDILTSRFQLSTDDCDGNGIPDECDPDCDGDGVPDACEIADCPPNTPSCADCNNDTIPDGCNITECCSIPELNCSCSQDCQPDDIPDDCQASGMVAVSWAADVGDWSFGSNWCPDLGLDFPDNDVTDSFDVTIAGPTTLVTLDVSPSVDALSLADAATVEVNDGSGANVRTLAIDGTIINDAILRATDRERLVLDAPQIDQTGGGLIEATDGAFDDPSNPDEPGAKSILEINGSLVIGGTARATEPNSEIHLIGGAELQDVTVEGIVVPDGQQGSFSGLVANEGIMTVSPNGSAITLLTAGAGGGTLQGVDDADEERLRLGGEITARLGDFEGSFVNAANHVIDGAGIILGGMTNAGLVRADQAGQHLSLFPPGLKVNDGTILATDGGMLRISAAIGGTGLYEALAGTIALEPDGATAEIAGDSLVIGGDTLTGAEGAVTVDENATILMTGALTVSLGGRLEKDTTSPAYVTAALTIDSVLIQAEICPPPPPPPLGFGPATVIFEDGMSVTVNQDVVLDGTCAAKELCNAGSAFSGAIIPPPVMLLIDQSVMDIDGSFILQGFAQLFHDSSEVIRLGGDFYMENAQAPACFNCVDGGFQLNGPGPTGPQLFEVAGEDLGATVDGFDANFAIGSVEVSAGADVTFVDNFANSDGVCEALYVHDLTFRSGATVTIDNCLIYYETLANEGVAPMLLGCAALQKVSTSCSVPAECDDGNPCTSEDCVGSMCVYTNTTDPCDDGDPCNGVDICDGAGTCIHQLTADCNGNGIDDSCDALAEFVWIGPDGGSFAEPANWDLGLVPGGDALLSNSGVDDNRCILNSPGEQVVCALTIQATGAGAQILEIGSGSVLVPDNGTSLGAGGQIVLQNGELGGGEIACTGGVLTGQGTVSANIISSGTVQTSPAGDLLIAGSSFENQVSGTLLAQPGSFITVTSQNVVQAGTLEISSLAGVHFDQALVNLGGASIDLTDGTLSASVLTNQNMADVGGFGNINADVVNAGQMTFVADTQILGDLQNDGSIIVQSGTLTILGSLSGSGEIIGDFAGFAGGNHGLTVIGAFGVQASASLILTDMALKAGGNVDIAIDDPARFDLSTLQLVGLPGAVQQLETLAPDAGSGVILPDQALFSIATLRVGPTATSVQLVDGHDNSPGTGSEVLYVQDLVLDQGVALDLAGLKIYYATVTPQDPFDPLSGVTVSDSVGGGDLIAICPADFNGSGSVDAADLATLLGAWGPYGPCPPYAVADINADCTVNATDLALLLGSWGPCN